MMSRNAPGPLFLRNPKIDSATSEDQSESFMRVFVAFRYPD